MWPGLPLLDEVDDDNGAAVPLQHVVKVLPSGYAKGLLNTGEGIKNKKKNNEEYSFIVALTLRDCVTK